MDHKGISPYNTFWGPRRYFISPWRYQICIARFLYSYRDKLLKNVDKTIAKKGKKYTSGWRALLKNALA